MYHILSKSDESTIGIQLRHWVETKDLATLIPYLKDIIKQDNMIRVLLELKDYKGTTFSAIFKTLLFLFINGTYVEKFAIVTDDVSVIKWLETLAFFSKLQIRFYPLTSLDPAWEWIKK